MFFFFLLSKRREEEALRDLDPNRSIDHDIRITSKRSRYGAGKLGAADLGPERVDMSVVLGLLGPGPVQVVELDQSGHGDRVRRGSTVLG